MFTVALAQQPLFGAQAPLNPAFVTSISSQSTPAPAIDFGNTPRANSYAGPTPTVLEDANFHVDDFLIAETFYVDGVEIHKLCTLSPDVQESSGLARVYQMGKTAFSSLVKIAFHVLHLSPWADSQVGTTLEAQTTLIETSSPRYARAPDFNHIYYFQRDIESESFWESERQNPSEWSESEKLSREIPQYVFDYAPLVHLNSEEQYWPGDLAEHLKHTTPYLDYDNLTDTHKRQNLSDLDKWNKYLWNVYLTSDDDVEDLPEWLLGKTNIPQVPDDEEEGDNLQGPNSILDRLQQTAQYGIPRFMRSDHKLVGGKSTAPAILIVVPKDDGIVDAFWFFFYSFNLGNTVANVRFGNHVGDWEHTLVRFENGKPTTVFLSEHNWGAAYEYDAVDKIGKRPLLYSAVGTHAMYATPGVHAYILPWGLLHDTTDKGPLWDPLLNSHAYTYSPPSDILRSSTHTPHAPTSWFYFMGHWGDKAYPESDPRQYKFMGQKHYGSGPRGPRFKRLYRETVCQRLGECMVKKTRELGCGVKAELRQWWRSAGRRINIGACPARKHVVADVDVDEVYDEDDDGYDYAREAGDL